MKKILIATFKESARRWEHELGARLRSLGHDVYFAQVEGAPPMPFLDAVLALESWRGGPSSASLTSPPPADHLPDALDLLIDLTGKASARGLPVLTIEINGCPYLPKAFALLRSGSGLVDITARLDGKPIGGASPMISDKAWLSRDVNEVLAAAQSLIAHSIACFEAGRLEEVHAAQVERAPRFLAPGYMQRLVTGLGARALRKLRPGHREFSWQTAYRFIDGRGIAEDGQIADPPFTVLADDGQRFYADPFPMEHEGRQYLFVEEYPYARGRGIISVAELSEEGKFDRPRPVLEEPHHLSYPNVFAREGSIFMIPESGSADQVVLYRAQSFPDHWVRDTVLIEGRNFNDATLLEHQGRLWMFGTERFGSGSASDTMMVYSADNLRGPWEPHPLNPIVIDRAGARPGGNTICMAGKIFLPVQDGTETYGGGLGLREIVKLEASNVELGPVLPIMGPMPKARARIHTLNRAGRLEVIDSPR
ncbi:glucosamine inositolphosphorylceramide transferase family protein [Neorhizobium sp. DT-125]|uniref:glucosamine inositolphosphorylceramide transferase family protein n=1 Tax=Neorhizobium sp. DT-125 TaxID=3396163 RepID=UPI003F1D139A